MSSIYYPKCYNKDCKWNMGINFKKGYEYLKNSCYHNADSNDFIKCKNKILEDKKNSCQYLKK